MLRTTLKGALSPKELFTLVQTPRFRRHLNAFGRRNPHLRSRVERVLAGLRDDPFHEGLRLHELSGRQAGLQAVRVTGDVRLILRPHSDRGVIELLDIGTHRQVYR